MKRYGFSQYTVGIFKGSVRVGVECGFSDT